MRPKGRMVFYDVYSVLTAGFLTGVCTLGYNKINISIVLWEEWA